MAYNSISDLSQLTWLDHLEVLDLEGNDIEDIDQMQYLGLCGKLSRLTVEGNLICLKPSAGSAEVRLGLYTPCECLAALHDFELEMRSFSASSYSVLPSDDTGSSFLLVLPSCGSSCPQGAPK